MHIPAYALPLDKMTETQIRLGIQGYFKTGKTWAALTFPNPCVVNLDRGLGAHIGRADVVEIPFWDKDFCKRLYPKLNPTLDLKEILLTWLQTEAHKLTAEQTLVWDGGTGTQNAYHAWYAAYPVISARSGKEDDFAQWRIKVEFFGQLCEEFKKLKCNVIYICHEAEAKDKKTGDYTGKIRPLLTGQFQDQLGSHFSDWFRQKTADKPDISKLTDAQLAAWGMKTKEEFQAMCDTFPRNTLYYWQTESDDTFDGGCSSLVNFPRFIPANYTSFCKFSKRISPKV